RRRPLAFPEGLAYLQPNVQRTPWRPLVRPRADHRLAGRAQRCLEEQGLNAADHLEDERATAVGPLSCTAYSGGPIRLIRLFRVSVTNRVRPSSLTVTPSGNWS